MRVSCTADRCRSRHTNRGSGRVRDAGVARRLEPGVLIRSVIGDQFDDDTQSPAVRLVTSVLKSSIVP